MAFDFERDAKVERSYASGGNGSIRRRVGERANPRAARRLTAPSVSIASMAAGWSPRRSAPGAAILDVGRVLHFRTNYRGRPGQGFDVMRVRGDGVTPSTTASGGRANLLLGMTLSTRLRRVHPSFLFVATRDAANER